MSKYLFNDLNMKIHRKFFEYKKVSITKLQLLFKNLDKWYAIDYPKYTLYHTKYGTVFGKKDLKGNYYLHEAWWR